MRITNNAGMLLLGIYLIVIGVLPLVNLSLPGLSTIVSLIAAAAGVLILMSR